MPVRTVLRSHTDSHSFCLLVEPVIASPVVGELLGAGPRLFPNSGGREREGGGRESHGQRRRISNKLALTVKQTIQKEEGASGEGRGTGWGWISALFEPSSPDM